MNHFDFISDLHLSTTDFSWENKATSLFCIIAGNISSDRSVLYNFLEEISKYYELVFFIDGDLEHKCYKGNLEASYRNLTQGIKELDNVVFLHENVVLLNNVMLIGTNGWTTFDFSEHTNMHDTIQFLIERESLSAEYAGDIFTRAISDQSYMYNSVHSCQMVKECNEVILITNSVPKIELIAHNNDYFDTVQGDIIGNNGIDKCLDNDIQYKVSTWLFGKFHEDLDSNIDNVRFVTNPGKDRDLSCYFPKRIEF